MAKPELTAYQEEQIEVYRAEESKRMDKESLARNVGANVTIHDNGSVSFLIQAKPGVISDIHANIRKAIDETNYEQVSVKRERKSDLDPKKEDLKKEGKKGFQVHELTIPEKEINRLGNLQALAVTLGGVSKLKEHAFEVPRAEEAPELQAKKELIKLIVQGNVFEDNVEPRPICVLPDAIEKLTDLGIATEFGDSGYYEADREDVAKVLNVDSKLLLLTFKNITSGQDYQEKAARPGGGEGTHVEQAFAKGSEGLAI